MNPVYLRKGDQVSLQPIYQADLDAWLKDGWELPAPEPEKAPPESASEAEKRAVPKFLYKDGEESAQKVHACDISAWMAQGWTLEPSSAPIVAEVPQVEAEAPSEPSEEPSDEPAAMTSLDAEIQRLNQVFETKGWSSIRKEAISNNVDQHEDGWESTIPAIAAAIVAKQ